MFRRKPNELELRHDLNAVSRELAALNRELASQMILLASQTGETEPLIHAVQALQSSQKFYSVETAPRDSAEIQQALADTLLKIGRAEKDQLALQHSIKAYRHAITLASILGDEDMRRSLKSNYAIARTVMGEAGTRPSIISVA